MEKDNTILDMLDFIAPLTISGELEIVDYWDADLCAIGIKRRNRLMYISTYNYFDKSTVYYDYDLEILKDDETGRLGVFKEVREATLSGMVSEIKSFFELA